MNLEQYILKIIKSILSKNFSKNDKYNFFESLSSMLSSGIGILEAMNIVIKDGNIITKFIGNILRTGLNKGQKLSDIMEKNSDYFDRIDIILTKVGEETGTLPTVFKNLSIHYKFMISVKNKYISASIYPIILIILTIATILIMFLKILPVFFDLLDSMGNTQTLNDISFIRNIILGIQSHYIDIIIITGLIFYGSWIFFNTKYGKKIFDENIFKVYIIGKLTKYYYTLQYFKYLNLMYKSGIPYLEIFEILKDFIPNIIFQNMTKDLFENIRRGSNLYEIFESYNNIIGKEISFLVKTGEESSNLGKAFDNISDIYSEKFYNYVDNIGKLIEPVFIVIIGIIIGSVVYFILSIITSITTNFMQ